MRRRVVVTGVGCINPMGNDVETMWSGLKESRSGVGYISLFDAAKMPTRIAAEIRDWPMSEFGPDPSPWMKRGRHSRFAAGAAVQAVRDSNPS